MVASSFFLFISFLQSSRHQRVMSVKYIYMKQSNDVTHFNEDDGSLRSLIILWKELIRNNNNFSTQNIITHERLQRTVICL